METIAIAALTASIISFICIWIFLKYFGKITEQHMDKFFESELKWAESHIERTFDEALETIQKIKQIEDRNK